MTIATSHDLRFCTEFTECHHLPYVLVSHGLSIFFFYMLSCAHCSAQRQNEVVVNLQILKTKKSLCRLFQVLGRCD